MEFEILGPLRTRATVRPTKQRRLLATLLLQPNRFVSTDQLAEALWDGVPPRSALANLRTYVLALREVAPGITTEPTGYRLTVAPDELDSTRMERLATSAADLRRAGDVAGALATYREALALWRGAPLEDLAPCAVWRSALAKLNRLRHTVSDGLTEAALAAGDHTTAHGVLRDRLADDPYDEDRWAQLVRSLHASGRRHEALTTLREAVRVLADDLGVTPGEHLRRPGTWWCRASAGRRSPTPSTGRSRRRASCRTSTSACRSAPRSRFDRHRRRRVVRRAHAHTRGHTARGGTPRRTRTRVAARGGVLRLFRPTRPVPRLAGRARDSAGKRAGLRLATRHRDHPARPGPAGDVPGRLAHRTAGVHVGRRVFAALEDRHGAAVIRVGLGSWHRDRGELALALPHYERALERFTAIGDEAGEAVALSAIGSVWLRRRQPDAAEHWLRSAYDVTTRTGDHHRQAQTLGRLADLSTLRGEHEAATVDLRRAHQLLTAIDDHRCAAKLSTKLLATQAKPA